jgi:ABC-type cobalamin/Fe3+-siderophores transport system ATPase subunit
MAMLEAQNIVVTRQGRQLLNNVCARFERGKVNVIIGPNGAGKSTLLSCLAGLVAADSGAAMLDGVGIEYLAAKERARRIGLLPQNGEVNWDVLVRDLVALGRFAYFGKSSAAEDNAAIDAAMKTADCAQFAGRNVLRLSGGEKARVLLARVLAGQPEWMLADEPLANLDPRYQLELLAHLRRLADAGTGIVAVLHDLTFAARIADNVVLLQDGNVFAIGAVQSVMTPENLNAVFGINCEILHGADGKMVIVSDS